MSTKASIMRAIRQYCVETCCAGDTEYVRECPGGSLNVGVACPLHPFRFSVDPTPSVLRQASGRERAKKNFSHRAVPRAEDQII
jgi:hypothetical protein